MTTKSPVFPIPQQPQHFSDYGFDPQMDYLQVLEEARKHKRESSSSRSIEALHFKLQKPISKDDSKKKKNKWWRNALKFCKRKWIQNVNLDGVENDGTHIKNRANYRGAISGPVYITESRSGSSTPCRTSSRPTSGPLTWTLTPTRKGENEIPYLNLRELNLDQQQEHHRISTNAMPIYLVT
ncbi:hypothetical protein BVC80_8775g19 [Macleaya cordata]|uniref:Uncharacterized protein n=1 Tax=Macleaya cordata TaxID=56857 RepID=A0A200QSL0_MACCD|nr:hypothetical protein BVC80_8775g19 [Macleaya cordata]